MSGINVNNYAYTIMIKKFMPALACLLVWSAAVRAQPPDLNDNTATPAESDLSYKAYIHSDKRFKCLYGYAADKTGDHAAAIAIFEDCIHRWNDVFSLIYLAQIYDSGIGVKQDFEKSTALMKQGANVHDDTTYPSIARYHYGVALAEGRGTQKDPVEARKWLAMAAAEGVKEAADYLNTMDK